MEKLDRKCKFDVLSRPDSSVMLCEDETTVIVGIYGPVEAKTQRVLIDKAYVESCYRPKTGLPGIKDRFHEMLIRNICETALATSLYPRAAVLVSIQELHNSGQLVSCAINAACLAALDSGMDMKHMFAAVSCFLTIDETLQFKSPLNLNNVVASYVFVFDSIEGRILASHTKGAFPKAKYKEALELCREESANIFTFFKESIISRLP